MKKTLAIVIALFVCLSHTTGLCFAKFGVASSSENLCASVSLCEKIGGQVFRNWYDNAGNLTNRVDGNGCSLWRTYDAMNRLSAMEDVCSIDGSFLFSYDVAGNMSSAGSPELHHVFSYDAMNRLSSAQAILSYPFWYPPLHCQLCEQCECGEWLHTGWSRVNSINGRRLISSNEFAATIGD